MSHQVMKEKKKQEVSMAMVWKVLVTILSLFVSVTLGHTQSNAGSSDFGTSSSQTIRVPAHFIEKFSLLTIKRGDTAKLVCEAYGTRPITVQWLVQNSKTGEAKVLPVNPGSSFAGVAFETNGGQLGRSHLRPTQPSPSIGPELLAPNRMNAFQKDYILGSGMAFDDQRTVFELHISSSNLNDSGSYACKISNEFGDDVHNIELSILDVPSAPERVTIDGIWSRGISLTWSPSRIDGNSLITEYIIQYWKELPSASQNKQINKANTTAVAANERGGNSVAPDLWSSRNNNNNNVLMNGSDNGPRISSSSHSSSSFGGISVSSAMKEESVSPSVTSHIMSDKFSPGISYNLRMVGCNSFGRGPPSSIVRFTTKEEPPTAPPTDISVESKGSTILVVKWKSPPRESWNGIITGYKVGFKIISKDAMADETAYIDSIFATNDFESISKVFTFSDVLASSASMNSEEQQLILTGLFKDTTYVLVLQAYNSAGPGPFSQQVIVATTSNDPPEAPVLWVTGVTETSIKLKWERKAKPGLEQSSNSTPGNNLQPPMQVQDLTHYVLYYKDEKSPWLEIAFPVPQDNSNEYDLINLEPSKWYQIYMRAVSRKGPSDPSEILTIRTETSSRIPSSSIIWTSPPSPTRGVTDGSNGATNAVLFNDWPTMDNYPTFLKAHFVLPLAAAVVIIVVACSIAYVYVKSAESKAIIRKNGHFTRTAMLTASPSNFQYLGIPTNSDSSSNSSSSFPSRATSIVSEEGTITLRYSDSNGRPLLARPPIPTVLWAASQGPILEESSDVDSMSPYSTLPNYRQETSGDKNNRKSFRDNCNIQVNRLSTFNPLPPELPPPNKQSKAIIAADIHINSMNGSDNNTNIMNSDNCNYVTPSETHMHSGQNLNSGLNGPLVTFSSKK